MEMSMTHYIAVFMPTREGMYSIGFPDFPEAISEGNSLDDCMLMAADVLAITVEEYVKARRRLPVPSSPAQARVWAGSYKEDPGLITDGEFMYQLFAAPEMDATPVRVSVSLAKSVLANVDKKAKLLGLTRSSFLSRAAEAYQIRV
jgi:predicted RNase H-like HicB family nuclease